MKEARAAAAQVFRDLDSHDAEPEQLVDERAGNGGVIVHLTDERADLAVGELVDAVADQALFVGERGQRERRPGRSGFGRLRHVEEGSMAGGVEELVASRLLRQSGSIVRASDVQLTRRLHMLHKTSYLMGFHLHATDGEIGHVDDFLVDAEWNIRYLVVDTSNWIGGKSVLIAPIAIENIDVEAQEIRVKLTRSQIEHSPSVDTANIELIETMPPVLIL